MTPRRDGDAAHAVRFRPPFDARRFIADSISPLRLQPPTTPIYDAASMLRYDMLASTQPRR